MAPQTARERRWWFLTIGSERRADLTSDDA
jgi:hypothetical protein